MGLIAVLFGAALVIGFTLLVKAITRKSLDRETTRNMKFLGKTFAAGIGGIALLIFIFLLLLIISN
jgi:hypothetical protein